ncbi:DUF1768-domain-containing protein, partial [Mytilinidion resinicola]
PEPHQRTPKTPAPNPPPEDPNPTLFFYYPDEKPYGIFCQWHPSPFTVPTTSLQFMMCAKALYFADYAAAARILASKAPKEQQALGATVAGFSSEAWGRVEPGEQRMVKERVVEQGNWYKFTQNRALREVLLGTGERELAEAGSKDRTWGIGYTAKNAENYRAYWGANLLGGCLMRVRGRIRE